mgnify:FL=1
MYAAICLPVIEVDGWEEAQAPFYVKEPRRIWGKSLLCPECGLVFGWVHAYLRVGNAAPHRTSYLPRTMICEDCGGDPSLRNLHIFFYTDNSVLTGPRAVEREIRLAMKTKEAHHD